MAAFDGGFFEDELPAVLPARLMRIFGLLDFGNRREESLDLCLRLEVEDAAPGVAIGVVAEVLSLVLVFDWPIREPVGRGENMRWTRDLNPSSLAFELPTVLPATYNKRGIPTISNQQEAAVIYS